MFSLCVCVLRTHVWASRVNVRYMQCMYSYVNYQWDLNKCIKVDKCTPEGKFVFMKTKSQLQMQGHDDDGA